MSDPIESPTPPDPIQPHEVAERDRAIAGINAYLDWAVGEVCELQRTQGYEQTVADIGETLMLWNRHDLAGLASVAIGRLARHAAAKRPGEAGSKVASKEDGIDV